MKRLFALALVLLACLPALADPPPADPRVKAALARMNYPYKLNAGNDYELLFDLKGGRSQVVLVNSHTESYNQQLELREISSTAYKLQGPLSEAKANALLADNAQRKLGAWRTVSHDGATYVLYVVQLPANADAEMLALAIHAVMSTADKLEAQETGKDDY